MAAGKSIDKLSSSVGNLPTADGINELTLRDFYNITMRKVNVIILSENQTDDPDTLKACDKSSIENLILQLQLSEKIYVQFDSLPRTRLRRL